jgi:hypothetical protein
MHTIYIGDSENVLKRIKRNHCNGNVEASALRRHIAEAMGYKLKREKRPSGNTRIRIDLPVSLKGEKEISDYLRQGKWRVVTCDSYQLAKDFQWYAIEQLKPRLNRDRREYPKTKVAFFQKLLQQLAGSSFLDCNTIDETKSKPGVYILYHQEIPNKRHLENSKGSGDENGKNPSKDYECETSLDKVWRDLIELARSKDAIPTLSQHVLDEISVSTKGIIVVSERTSKPRLLTKEKVRPFWSVLEQKGILTREDIPLPDRMYVGRIIFSLLAHLPYVEYETKPQKLYLMPDNTHQLGTLKQKHKSQMK